MIRGRRFRPLNNAKVIREPGPMNAGTTIVAFLKDPDGYEIELLSRLFSRIFFVLIGHALLYLYRHIPVPHL